MSQTTTISNLVINKMTKEQYDALETKDPTQLYYVVDDVGVEAGSGLAFSNNTLNHSNSVTAGTAGTSSATSGATLAVPYVTYDAQGHITTSGTHTHTISSLATSAVSSGTFADERIASASTWNAKQDALTFDGTYDASTNKAATVSTITNAINALDGGTIGTGSTSKTITSLSQNNGNVSATFDNIAFPVTSVNTKTGDVVLSASDVGAQPTITVNGILKGNGSGTISKAVAGTDYQAPLPSQSTHSGNLLSTDGSSLYWKDTDTVKFYTIADDEELKEYNAYEFYSTYSASHQLPVIIFGSEETFCYPESLSSTACYFKGISFVDSSAKDMLVYQLFISSDTEDNYSEMIYIGGEELPSQSGNTGKFLQTSGTEASWQSIVFPVTSVNTKTGAVSLTASDVGALPDDTTIPQGTVTSVRVQATSPVQSSISTEQSTTLNTTISLADGYGDTKNPYGTKTANYVLAGPTSGTAAAPTFRALDASDIPSLTVSKISDFPSTMPPSSHTHGNITDGGDITTTSTIANGDRLVINDESASKVTNSSITFGTSETTFLTNKGTWATPSGTYSLPTASADTLGGIKVGTNLSISDGVLSATDTTYVFDGTYNASTNKAATVSTVTDAINALDGGTIGTGGASKTITALSQSDGNVSATFNDIAIAWSQVTSGNDDLKAIENLSGTSGLLKKTAANTWSLDTTSYVPTSRKINTKALSGDITLTASDVGALPDSTIVPTINVVTNPAITASSGEFIWTISASSAGGDMNPDIILTVYEISTGMVVYPNIVVNQSSGNVTITINDTASAGTLAAGTYKAVIIG